MADRYWVGGSGTWDNASTANWSATSGGASGASAPTSADNVIFNSLSNATLYTVTIGTSATALDVTIANPATGAVTFAGTQGINCYGSWTNAAGVVFSFINSINFLSTTTGRTITTNAVNLGSINVITNQVGGGWTLVGSLTFGGILSIQGGSFDTGNYNVTCAVVQAIGTAVRALTLGTSTITVSNAAPWVFSTTTNLTFSGASSTINCSNASPTFAGGGLTYGTVNFTSTSGGVLVFSGVNTFTTLNITSPTSNRKAIFIGNNTVVTGTLTLGAANAYNARIQVQSSNVGSAITLTVATIATLSDVDFRDITAAGASGTWSGTRLGNGLGNTNITFVAGKTVYWNLVAGGNWSANAWATSSGGAVATANFPLAQDTAIIDNTGLTASNTITLDAAWWIGTLNVTRTNAWTVASTNSFSIYGDVTLTSVTTVTGTAGLNFLGQGLTQTLTTNGVLLSMGISQTSVGGTLLLNGAVTCASTATVTLNNGTLNLASFTLSTGLFDSNNANIRTLAFGTGNITLTGNNTTIWTTNVATNLIVTGTPVVNCTYSGSVGTRSILGSGSSTEAYAINFNIAAASDIVNPANFLYKDFIVNGGFTGTITLSSTNLYGSLNLGGATSISGTLLTFSATSGTKTITSNGKTIDAPVTFNGVGGTFQLQDVMTVGSTRTTTLTNGTLDLAGYTLTTGSFSSTNSNTRAIAFGIGKIVVTANNAVVVNVDTATNFSFTGTSNIEGTYSGSVGARSFVVGNAAGGSQSVAMNIKVTAGTDSVQIYNHWNNVDFTGFSGSLSNTGIKTYYGNLTISTGMTLDAGATTLNFAATSGTKTITSNGKTMDFPVVFNGIGGTWLCTDALTLGSTRALTLTNGTLQSGGYPITSATFVSTGSGTRSLNLLNKTISVTGTGTVWTASGTNFSMGTNDTILLNSASAQTFSGGGLTYGVLGIGNANIKTITGSNTFYNIVNTVSPASVTFAAGSTNTFSNFSLNGTSGSLVTLRSTVPGTQYTLVKI